MGPDDSNFGHATIEREGGGWLGRLVPFLAVALMFLGLAGQADASAGTPVITAPSTGSMASRGHLNVAFSLPSTPAAGSVTVTFNGPVSSTLTLNGAPTNVSYTVVTGNLAPDSTVQSVAGSSHLPDGTYQVSVAYQDASDASTASASVNNVTVDQDTQPASLSSPAPYTTYGSAVSVNYTLPETPTPGTVSLTFVGASTSEVMRLQDSAAGTPVSFFFNPANPSAAPAVTGFAPDASLPDGTYAVTLSYQDQYGNPAAAVSAGHVTIDTVTGTPQLSAPVGNTVTTGTIPVVFSLPENALPGSVALGLTGSSNYTLHLADTAAGAHEFTFDPNNPTGSAEVSSISGGSTVTPGIYTITLRYQDAVGNIAASASAPAVTVLACGVGTYSATGMAPCTPADLGHYSTTLESTQQYPCVPGSYAAATGSGLCMPAPAGSYAPAAAALPIACPAGTWCPSSSVRPTPCPGGTYQPAISATSASACLTVAAGSAAPAGSSAPATCTAGTYAASDGESSCALADPGSFVAAVAATGEKACAAGTFSADAGSAACILAPAGTYAPVGARAAIPCPSGTTTLLPGQESCSAVTAPVTSPVTTPVSTPVRSPVAALRQVTVTRLSHGRLRIRCQATVAGTVRVLARVAHRRYATASTRRAATIATAVLRPGRRAATLVTARRIVVTVVFTPRGGGRSITRTITLRPVRQRRRVTTRSATGAGAVAKRG